MGHIEKFESFSYEEVNEGLRSWWAGVKKRRAVKNMAKKGITLIDNKEEEENFNKDDDKIINELISKLKPGDYGELKMNYSTGTHRAKPQVTVEGVSFYPSKATIHKLEDKLEEFRKGEADAKKSDVIKKIKEK